MPHAGFRDQTRALRLALGRVPGDRVLLVAAAPWEADWVSAGRLAGMVSADRYFA